MIYFHNDYSEGCHERILKKLTQTNLEQTPGYGTDDYCAVRRLLNDAGDDINDLMTLCEADITSKNQVRKQRFLDNFKMVREKLVDLQDRDYKRLLQPCIDGNEIMEMFQLKPCREVGVLKQYLKDAVLDNKVANEREPLMELLMKKAQDMGLNMAENLNRE